MGDSTGTQTRSGDVAVQTRCSCDWSRLSGHDELLQLEANGLDGVCELVAEWALEGSGDRGGTLGSADFEAFVAAHEWRDPVRMYRLARNLFQTFDSYRREGARTRTAFENEIAIVRCKAATLRASGDGAAADDLDQGISDIVAWIEGRQPTLP